MIPALIALGFISQEKPAVDRSAEQALKEVFAATSKLQNAHLLITYYRVGSSDYYLPDHTDDVWLGAGGKYRMELNTLSGDFSNVVVSDGMAIMTDPMNEDEDIQIPRAGKPIYEAIPREPWTYLVAGPDAFDRLVAKDQPVVFVNASGGQKAIELHNTEMGKIVITYRDSATPLPTRIDMFRAFRRRDNGAEMPTPTTKEYVQILSQGHVDSSLFTVNVPKGKKIDDQRSKSGS